MRVVADCRDIPSETDCTLTITGSESEVLQAAVTRALRMIKSPTLIGWRNCSPSTAAVTRRLRV